MGYYERWDGEIAEGAGGMKVKIRGDDGALMFVHFVSLLLMH